MLNIKTFKALRDYVKGRISADDLVQVEKLFSYVMESTNKGESIINIEFKSNRDFLEKIGMSGDDIWIYEEVTSPYSSYEFFDRYSSMEDFMEGGGLYFYLDEENKELLEQISKAILPMKFDLDDDKFRRELSEKLIETFKSNTQNIIDEYSSEKNDQIMNSLEDAVEKEMEEYFSQMDFEFKDRGFEVAVADLLMLYMQYNAIHLPLGDLLEKVFSDSSDAPGGWAEDWYNYTDDEKFDVISFNRYANRQLEEILETIQEDGEEEGVLFEDYLAMINRITKKFEQGKFYYLPKDSSKETLFKVEGFEYPSMKITIQLSRGRNYKTINLTEENFYHLLFQPSLFNLDAI